MTIVDIAVDHSINRHSNYQSSGLITLSYISHQSIGLLTTLSTATYTLIVVYSIT